MNELFERTSLLVIIGHGVVLLRLKTLISFLMFAIVPTVGQENATEVFLISHGLGQNPVQPVSGPFKGSLACI